MPSDPPESENPSYYGQIREFDAQNSDWTIYKRRLENYFIVNGIKDNAKKRAILLNALNEEAYKLMYSLCIPSMPETKTYEQLVKNFDEHFKISESPLVARSKFFEAFRNEHESVNEWAARVRSLAIQCEFDAAIIDMMLRDRFIMGFGKGAVQSKLFKEKVSSSFSTVIGLAVTEMAADGTSGVARDCQSLVKQEPGIHLLSSGRRHHIRQPTASSSASTSSSTQHEAPGGTLEKCKCCGRGNHSTKRCRYRKYTCDLCQVVGHLANVCPKRGNRKKSGKSKAKNVQNFIENDDNVFTLCNENKMNEPYTINLLINNKFFSFQLDSGASISAFSEMFWRLNFKDCPLIPTNRCLNVYDGKKMFPLGVCKLSATYNHVTKVLNFYVIKNGGPPILGRDFMNMYKLGIAQVNYTQGVKDQKNITYLVNKFNYVFSGGLGKFNRGTVSLKLKNENTTPKFLRARPLPYGLRDKVESELNNLINLGVLKPVDYSCWATPIVPVIKKSGSVRICGDFKVTINPVLKVDHFPLPKIDDLFARLQGGAIFSKLDLAQAYAQICLDDESKKLVTIATHKGLFQYQRLPYGVACAPAQFQKIIESLVSDIEGCVSFLDDILISGRNMQEHMFRVERVLSRLQETGLKVSLDKCDFFADKVEYLGYIISKEGLQTSPKNILAIENAPAPKSVVQLQSVLGMINYYGKFVPNLSTVLSPLYNLLKKDVKWSWNEIHEAAFKKIKQLLTSAPVLVHYNPNYELKLTTDASPYGIGGVLSHIMPNGEERPIAYSSRTLSSAEKGYSQIEREGLAIIFGLCKFNQYLYGRPFTLVSDNKPLLAIFNPMKGIPQYSANRLRRWAVILSNYQYKLQYIKSKENCADFLSRSPTETNDGVWESVDVDYVNYFSDNHFIATNFEIIKRETVNDSTLRTVIEYVSKGWKKEAKNNVEVKRYFNIRNDLTLENNVLLWNNRIVIPDSLRSLVLKQLHESHLGIIKMKCIARKYFYWPGINKDIENLAMSCENCVVNKASPPKNVLQTWNWPENIFERIHIDYFGPFLNKHFLIVLDAHSKWIEVFSTSTPTSNFTIRALETTFSRFGFPKVVVSDNARYFTSTEFENFMHICGIKHVTSPPFHPQSNGAAENSVKNVKLALKNCLGKNKSVDIDSALNKFLFDYRNVPHGTTGVAPSYLMFNREISTRFDILNPIRRKVENSQALQRNFFRGKKRQSFDIGDKVIVKDYRQTNKVSWLPGVIKKMLGNCIYIVYVPELNHTVKRHINQILRTRVNASLPVAPPTVTEAVSDNNMTSNLDRPRRVIKAPERLICEC